MKPTSGPGATVQTRHLPSLVLPSLVLPSLVLPSLVLVGLVLAGLFLGGHQVAAAELDLLPLGDPDRAPMLGAAAQGEIFDCRAGAEIGLEEMIDAFAESRVVLLGEEHTSMDQKLEHARILAALAERGVPLVLGMEFFQRDDREALAGWVAGELDEEELLRKTKWYDRGGYRFDYYRPVMTVAREHGIPVVGINVPRSILRAINRGGLDSLDDEQQAQIGAVDTGGSPQHRYLISRYFGDTAAMMPPSWFENMYAAQCTWDVVMARSILADLPPEGTMVVVVGSGHVAYGLGIPRRLRDERLASGEPPLPVSIFCPVDAPAPDPDAGPGGHPMGHGMMGGSKAAPARFVRSLADVVEAFDPPGPELFPTLGLRFVDDAEVPTVMMAFPGSAAAGAGVHAGDRVLDVNGEAVESLTDLRWVLSKVEWGSRLDLRVERAGDQLDLAMLLLPDLVETETTVAPGWTVSQLAAFDPAGFDPRALEPVQASPRPDAEEAVACLVSSDATPRRIEVRLGSRLDEVHELDEQGRVVRSLYRVPRPDSAVEVRLKRDAEGHVIGTTRLDRTGSVLGSDHAEPEGTAPAGR